MVLQSLEGACQYAKKKHKHLPINLVRMVADLMVVDLLPSVGPILPSVSLSLKIWTGLAIY